MKDKSFIVLVIYKYIFYRKIYENLTIALVAGYFVSRKTVAVISWHRVDTL